MSAQSSDRSRQALADLNTLINLLSLRDGNPIDLDASRASQSETDEKYDDIDDTSFDSDDLDGIAGHGVDSAALEKLRKRFLDRLAEMFAAERDGASVTAAMLREVEREDRVDIWLARNNGFKRAKDTEMIKATEKALCQIAQDPHASTAEFRARKVEYCSQRLEYYEGEIRKRLSERIIIAQCI